MELSSYNFKYSKAEIGKYITQTFQCIKFGYCGGVLNEKQYNKEILRLKDCSDESLWFVLYKDDCLFINNVIYDNIFALAENHFKKYKVIGDTKAYKILLDSFCLLRKQLGLTNAKRID